MMMMIAWIDERDNDRIIACRRRVDDVKLCLCMKCHRKEILETEEEETYHLSELDVISFD
jgi:hypothetical protein